MSPNLQQLQTVIAKGNDSVDNILLLMTSGTFMLVETSLGGTGVQDYDYVTRWETFDAENDYVGENASQDMDFLNNTIMNWALQAWNKYNETGNTQILNPNS